MSKWLKTTSFTAPLSNTNNGKIDEVAAYSSFVQHWQHTLKVIESTKIGKITCDEVTAVINHFGQMVNLLVVDLHQLRDVSLWENRNEDKYHQELKENGMHHQKTRIAVDSPPTPIYDHLLRERILESVLSWSQTTGEYMHTMQLELLKNYETILNNSHPEILIYKPITKPLQNLLQMCSGCVPVEVEKRLVVLLNHLWVSLLHNHKLLNHFYFPEEKDKSKQLVIFSLLLPFAHREGGIGQQARDALLLCMCLSASNSSIAEYIALHSNFCPIVAAGLSGLYSMLPRTLQGKHTSFRIALSDVPNSPHLQMFMNSLEFCNAIVQTAHPLVQDRLVDLLYQGFLRPVIGPALCQGVTEEVITAIVYVELFLHAATENQLQRAFLALLLLPQVFCELPIINNLISQLRMGSIQLTLVVTNLLNTIIAMHNEDAMITLVFQFLSPCTHIMLSQIAKLLQPNPLSSSDHFINLLPTVCEPSLSEQFPSAITNNTPLIKRSPKSSSLHHSLDYQSSYDEDRKSSYDSNNPARVSTFCHYLKDSRLTISKTACACSTWQWKFNGRKPFPREAMHLLSKCSTQQPFTTSDLVPDKLYQSLPCSRPFSSSRVIIPLRQKRKRALSLPNLSYKSKVLDSEDDPFTSPCCGSSNEAEIKGVFKKDLGLFSSPLTPRDTLVHSWYTLVYDDRGAMMENSHDSIDESSGYESFTFKDKGVSNLSSNGSVSEEKCSLLKDDDEFLLFLDGCEIPVSDNDSLDEEFSVIDEAFSIVNAPNLHLNTQHNNSNRKEKFVTKLNGVRMSTSMSSFEEIKVHVERDNSFPLSSSQPSIGPFLDSLLNLVDNFLLLNVDAIVLVMSCITGLASYPCSLLTTILLQPSLVLQPSVRSLYQILGQVKQKIDLLLSSDDLPLLLDARRRLSNWWPETDKFPIRASPSPFVREGIERRSFSQTVSAFFKRGFPDRGSGREALQNLPDGAGYRYFNTPKNSNSYQLSEFNKAPADKQHAALCSALLQDWLLELTALLYEQTVYCPEMVFTSLKKKLVGQES